MAGRKIAWISDYYMAGKPTGGAEVSDYYWKQSLKESGVHIREIRSSKVFREKYDFAVVSNVYNLSPSIPYVIIQHNSFLTVPTLEAYKNAKGVMFLAPDHQEKCGLSGLSIKTDYAMPYVDPSEYFDLGKQRWNRAVFVGLVIPHKGIKETAIMCKEKGLQLDVYGDIADKPYARELERLGVTLKGRANQIDLNTILNNYRYFAWHLPRYGSYGRVIVEAVLAGCELLVNRENFGLFEYGDIENRDWLIEKLDEERYTFWNKLRALVYD